MEDHIEGTMSGDTFRGYIVWRLIYGVQCMENHKEATMYVDSHVGYRVWGLI